MLGFFPVPYPDELLFGVVARLHRLLGQPANTPFAIHLFGNRHGTPNILVPRYLEHLAERLPPNFPLSAEELKKKHTLTALFDTFQEQASLEGHLVEPSHLFSCPTCRREDLDKHGEAYWHRSHQIPFGQICHLHSVPLHQSQKECGNRGKPTQKLPIYFLPNDTGWKPLPAPREQTVYQRFHHRVQIILNRPERLAPSFRTLLATTAEKEGLRKHGLIQRTELHRYIKSKLGQSAQTLFQLSANRAHAARTIRNIFAGRTTNPYHAMLLYEVFDLSINTVLDTAEIPRFTPKAPAKTQASTRLRHRNTFRLLLEADASITRKELALKALSTSAWLRANDREWLTLQIAHIPLEKPHPPKRNPPTDSRGVEAVEKAVRLLKSCQKGKPQWITMNRIRNILPYKDRSILKECQHLPLTQTALTKVLDTPVSVARKRIAWRLNTLKGPPIGLTQFHMEAGLLDLVRKHPAIRKMAAIAYQNQMPATK